MNDFWIGVLSGGLGLIAVQTGAWFAWVRWFPLDPADAATEHQSGDKP